MTYPPSSSGYPPSQQPTTQFSAPTQQFGKPEQASAQSPAATAAGPSRLPFILLAAIGVLGLLVYLFSFGPQFKIESTDFPQLGSATGTSLGLGLAVVAALLSALIAAASLLPNQKAPVGIIAAVAVLAFLLVIAEVIQTPEGVSLGWGLYVVIFLTLVQAALGIGALLLDAGIIKAPVSKPKQPKYEQQPQYGQYGGPNQYYGQHAPAPGWTAAASRRTRASTVAATRAGSRPAVAMRRPASRAARRPPRPASRHTASRRRRSPRPPVRAPGSRSRSRRPRRLRRISPATRRHNLLPR